MYEALILLSEGIAPKLGNYVNEISAFYEKQDNSDKPAIKSNDLEILIEFEGIKFIVQKNCSESVSLESSELQEYLKLGENSGLSKSKCRYELKSSSDFEMTYFNDYLFILQAAEKLGKVWLFDPNSGKLI